MLLFITGVESPGDDSIKLKNPPKQSKSKYTTIKQKCSKTKQCLQKKNKHIFSKNSFCLFDFLLKMKNIYKQKNLFVL